MDLETVQSFVMFALVTGFVLGVLLGSVLERKDQSDGN